jgi:NAD+ synthase (glutamine-hydrolysing)
MKIALVQLNYHIGNFEFNTAKIIDAISKAKSSGADIVIFAELAICGYPPRDFLQFGDFINKCESSIKEIATHCKNIAAIVGGPSRNPNLEGKNLFNSAYFLMNGEIKDVIHKSLLPTYDVFDEYRYFEPNRKFKLIDYKGKKIALTICEDIWDIKEDPLYTISPMDYLIKDNPDIMINIAASPFSYTHAQKRKEVLKTNALKYKLPVFYTNHIGAQTELIFDGGSCAFDKAGNLISELKYFEEDLTVIDMEAAPDPGQRASLNKSELIHDALVLGIRDYFYKLGFKKSILGLSGGIDSALVAVLSARALGAENTYLKSMPSEFSSDHSVSDAEQLARNLGSPYELLSISPVYNKTTEVLQTLFKDLPFDTTEENIQARIRAVLLMAVSNKFGYILLNTSNKSELAIGYGTLYGDMCGGLSVIGDLYKTEIYELANYINREEEIIPQNTINKPPSAELRPDQKDTDSLPPYDVLDKILFLYVDSFKSPKEIVEAGFDQKLVDKVLKMVNTTEYKRKQTPPILRISDKAFGMGRRMPIVAKYLS